METKEKKLVTGRVFGSNTMATRNEDGSWTVTVDMVEKRRLNGEDWEDKTVITTISDQYFERAYVTAMNATIDKFSRAVEESGSDSMFPSEDELIVEPPVENASPEEAALVEEAKG